MQRVYRTMLCDHRAPAVGTDQDMLGACVPADVRPAADGRVGPGAGISVAPDWHRLPPGRVPRRLRSLRPGARAEDDRCVWVMGDDPCVQGLMSAGLRLALTSSKHGQIEPSEDMPLVDYQGLLAGTKHQWQPVAEDSECPARLRIEDPR